MTVRGGFATLVGSGTCTVTLPAGTAAGDLVLLQVRAGTMTGWTRVPGTETAPDPVWQRLIVSGDVTAGSFTIPALSPPWRVRGVVLADLVASSTAAEADTSVTSPLSFGDAPAGAIGRTLVHFLAAAVQRDRDPGVSLPLTAQASDYTSENRWVGVAVRDQDAPAAYPPAALWFDTAGAGSCWTVAVAHAASSANRAVARLKLRAGARSTGAAFGPSLPVRAVPQAIPTQWPAPAAPAVDLVEPLVIEAGWVKAVNDLYPDVILTDGRVQAGWGPV